MLDPLAAERGIRLTRRLDSSVPPVLADADLLSRAIGNLVSNAVKYSPPKTEVVISARNAANGVSIEVADQGYGIPEGSCGSRFRKVLSRSPSRKMWMFPALASASPWCGRSPNCTADRLRFAVRWVPAPYSRSGFRVPRDEQ